MRGSEYENKLKQQAETILRQAEMIGQQAETIGRQGERIEQLEAEIGGLKKLLEGKAEAKTAKKPKFTENYSLGKHNRKVTL